MTALLSDLEQESLRNIGQRVADGFGFTLAGLRQPGKASRAGRLREARAIICWLADKTTTLPAATVARWLAVPDRSVYDWAAQIEAKASTTPAYQAMLLSMAPDDYARRRRAISIIHNADASRRAIRRGLEINLEQFHDRLIRCLDRDALTTLAVLQAALDQVEPPAAALPAQIAAANARAVQS